MSSALYAQSTATVSGRIFNQATQSYLQGAEVRLPDGRSTYTDNTGAYEFSGVAAGPVKLAVSYAGLDTTSVEVNAVAGQRVSRDIGLTSAEYGPKSDVVALSTFVVASEREGRAAALTQQQRAENIVNIISADEFPNVAGGNIGEFLRNIPGVVVDYSGADPRAIRVRGMDPNMNAVTVDGMPAANAASGNTNRQFEIDQISLQNVESIEVTKAPTAAQDASTGGGSVNMVSKSAFLLKGRRIQYTVNINANSKSFDWGETPGPNEHDSWKLKPGGNFSYMNSFFNNRLGVAFNVNHYTFYTQQPNTTINWTNTPAAVATALGLGSNASEYRYAANGQFAKSFNYGSSAVYTRRASAALNLDYRVSDATTLFLNSQVNTSYIRAWGRNLNLQTADPVATAATTNRVAPGFTDQSLTALGDINGTTITAATSTSQTLANVSSGDLLNKLGTGTTFSAGAKHRWGPWRVDYAGSISQSTNHYRLGFPEKGDFGRADFYQRGISFDLQTPAGSPFPIFTPVGQPSQRFGVTNGDLYDLGRYTSRTTTTNSTTNVAEGTFTVGNTRDNNALDRFTTLRANVRRDFALRFPVYVQAGAQFRQQKRFIDNEGRRRWFYVGPDGIANTADDAANLGQFVDTSYTGTVPGFPRAPFPSLSKITAYYKASPQAFKEDIYYNIQTEAQNIRSLKEEIGGVYAMTGIKLNRLNILLGLRGERTEDTGEGPVTNNAAAAGITDRVQQAIAIFTTKRASGVAKYERLFPNAQARYELTKNIVLRASYNESIGRQNFGNIIPGATISNAATPIATVVTVNNPALRPQIFSNYDASIEWYLQPVGVLSAGFFHKDITNYTRSFDQTILAGVDYNVAGVDLAPYVGGTLRRSENVGSAEVDGIEISYSQQLSRYAAWLRGWGVFANYTHLETKGNYGALTQATLPLDNFVPETINGGLSYRRGRFDGSIKYNYKGAYLGSGNELRYNVSRGTLDLSAAYKVWGNHTAFVEVKNVTDESRGDYRVHAYRIRNWNEDGAIINFGVKGTF